MKAPMSFKPRLPAVLTLMTVALAASCSEQSAAPAAVPPDASAPPAAREAAPAESAAFRMSVADSFKIHGKGVVITGRIESGRVSVGDSVCLTAARIGTRTLRVEGIEIYRKVVDSASAGETPGLLVDGVEPADITRPGDDKLSGGDC
ncbi:MAG: EF-Tu/IF-2/RF-3 family GTPase [Lysobacterales bacterium]